MCLGTSTKVVELLAGDLAIVELGGVRKQISLALVDGIESGDYVIVHVGFALEKLNTAEADRTLALMAGLAIPHVSSPAHITAAFAG